MSRNTLKNLILLAAAVGIALLVAEFALKTFAPQKCYAYPKGMVTEDATLCYGLSSNFSGRIRTAEFDITVKTNSHGLRDDEHSYEKPPGTIRILGLGDSFQFGVGVEHEETYLELFEKRLAEGISSGKKVEVINAGVLGYGTRQELQYFKEEGKKYKPDLVLLSFYQNDFLDNEVTEQTCNRFVRDGYLVENFTASQRDAAFKVKLFLNQKSDLYCLAKNSALKLVPAVRIGSFEVNVTKETVLAYSEKGNYSREIQQRINPTLSLIKELKGAAEKEGAKLAIILIPDQIQVDKELWQKIVSDYNVNPGSYDLSKLNGIIMEFAAAENITAVDLLPEFRKKAETKKLYYPIEAHLNRNGHAMAAEILASKLEFLPDAP